MENDDTAQPYSLGNSDMDQYRAAQVIGEMVVHGIAALQRLEKENGMLFPASDVSDAIEILLANWKPEWIETWCRDAARRLGHQPVLEPDRKIDSTNLHLGPETRQ